MLMTMFVVGLNAPSLPLLPLFTWAWALAHKSKAITAINTLTRPSDTLSHPMGEGRGEGAPQHASSAVIA